MKAQSSLGDLPAAEPPPMQLDLICSRTLAGNCREISSNVTVF